MSLRVDISKSLAGFELCADFEAPSGITVLFGPSGSGKTTLINAVAGLLTPDSGRIALGERALFDAARGINLPAHKRGVGYVFQDARLFPHLSVEANLNYGRKRAANPPGAAEFDRIVTLLGLGALLGRRPAKLSGGEAQRVALGRALLSGPKLLLADEPLAALDGARKGELLPYFERLRDAGDLPILYVTHSVSELGRLANHVVTLSRGRASGLRTPADVLADPRLVSGGVRGVGAMITAVVVAHHNDGLSELDAGGVPLFLPKVGREIGAHLRVRIAASDVILSRQKPEGLSALNILKAKIVGLREGEGPGAIVALETAAGQIQARLTQRSAKALGLAVGLETYAVVKTVSIAQEDVGG
ncbi:molybdenum ABC transporter ATP-binding protein [uncultured Lentibacter sp.]|uniref:molybdenum ABC transporter ATP-binding protein n=1 Tax=uncultured Lentibacter sp. TaxID=1659309 RepID=UPI002602B19D|nr:molybdenum ABC transporter ATP-binding protein [uncultured Lentibacter sp.]MCW1956301.1 molybdenum ABC transporter ATP-binding protein [Roseobacter sp.]